MTGKYDEVANEVKAKFFAVKMEPPKRPKHPDGRLVEPELPADLTALNDVDLGRLFSEFCCMAQYALFHMAAKSVRSAAARAAEKYTRSMARLRKDGTVQDKEAQVETDPEVAEKVSATLVATGVETLTDALHKSYLIGRDACSREMSRRQWSEGTKDGYQRK